MGPMREAILGVVRHGLTAAGGGLVTSGVLDAAAAQTAVGAIVALIGVIWSVIEKRQRA